MNLPSICWDTAVDSPQKFIFVKHVLSEDYRVILPTFECHGEEYHNRLCLPRFCFGDPRLQPWWEGVYVIGVSLGGQIAMELFVLRQRDIEKAII